MTEPDGNSNPSLNRCASGRNSLRKLLPVIPESSKSLQLSRDSRDGLQPAYSVMSNMDKTLKEYELLGQYKLFLDQKLPGLYLIPSSRSLYEWYGVLFVHSHLYQGGVFRFTLIIPSDFPESVPRLYFELPVFHPNVNSQTGELDFGKSHSKWNPKVHAVHHTLIQARKLMHRPDFLSPVLQEASCLYADDKNEFKKRVDESILLCRTRLFNSDIADPHYPKFSPFNKSIHGPVMKFMKQDHQPKMRDSLVSTQGLSWVKNGSLIPFASI